MRTADTKDTAENEASLVLFNLGFSKGTVTNYLSKIRAVAKYLANAAPIAGETFTQMADRLTPQVKAQWGAIRDIRMQGPASKSGEKKKSRSATALTSTIDKSGDTSTTTGSVFIMVRSWLETAEVDDIRKLADLCQSELLARDVLAHEAAVTTVPMVEAA